MFNSERCDYLDCANKAEYLDLMGDPVCESCMNEEIENGQYEPEDYVSIGE